MNAILKVALALTALGVATPALAWVDFEWYANVGRTTAPATAAELIPPERAGYIWTPTHTEARGEHQVSVAGHFIRDDFAEQTALYNTGAYGIAPLTYYDSQGNLIVASPR
jgi:hypothetical protein